MSFLNIVKSKKNRADDDFAWIAKHAAQGAAMPKDILEAHPHCNDKDEILSSSECACFYCFARFTPDKVEWGGIDDTIGLCPSCGIDAILGDKSGYELNDVFLREMYKYWFAS